MQRDLSRLAQSFDVTVIGGGIYGAVISAVLSGIGQKVLVIDKGDFCSATSANSLKILHGGLRYLQHLHFRRMRQSIFSRRALMAAAPHLSQPLGCVMPTKGHGLRSRWAMQAALVVNDLISWDRNQGLPPHCHLPRGRILGRAAMRKAIPGLAEEEISGGALWYDGLAVDTERMGLDHLLRVADSGGVIMNYMKADRIICEKNRVAAVQMTDLFSGRSREVATSWVVNAAGPWFAELLRASEIEPLPARWAKAVNLIVRARLHATLAVGLESTVRHLDRDAVFKRGKRLYFFVPWRGGTMIGTSYSPFTGNIDSPRVSREEIQVILDEVNRIYPGFALTMEHVTWYHGGLVPLADDWQPDHEDLRLAKETLVHHHGDGQGPEQLISLRTIKYTTAPRAALAVAAMITGKKCTFPWVRDPGKSVVFGDMQDTDLKEHLHGRYGFRAPHVFTCLAEDDQGRVVLSEDPLLLTGEIRYCIREEMACTLEDLVLRRTDLGTFSCPDHAVLVRIARVMAAELGWDEKRQQEEISRVKQRYHPCTAGNK